MKRINVSCIILICIYSSILYGQSNQIELIEHIQERVGLSKENAISLINMINNFAINLQTNITYMASSNDSRAIKEKKIDEIIKNYFMSVNSEVQVSSLNENRKLSAFKVFIYFQHLINLKKFYKYTKVELLFAPDYLGIGQFYHTKEKGTYEVSISMWQLFIGYVGDNISYKDLTKKKFRLFFKFVSEEGLYIKVDQILVLHTLPEGEDEFHFEYNH